MKRALHSLMFAAAAGLTVCFAFLLAFYGGHEVSREVPAAPWLALILLVSTPLLGRIGRWALGPRGPVAAALGLALVAPLIALGALHELNEPLIYEHPPMCGTPRVMLEMSVAPAMLAAGVLGALAASRLVAAAGARADRAVRAVLAASAAVAAVLLVASLLGAARHPETDGYVASLPVVAAVGATAVGPATVVTRAVPARGKPYESEPPSPPVDVYDDAVDGVLLRRVCAEHRCFVGLVPRGTPPADATFGAWDVDEGRAIVVRRDPARALWVVGGFGQSAFLGPELRHADVLVRSVASSLSPPRGWILGAAAGLAIAGAVFSVRRRAARRRAALAAGREGTLEPSGLLRLAGDEHPLRVAPGQALAVGPVVVLPGPIAPGGVYRGDALPGGARVACGDREDLLAAADATIAHLDALALATVALTAAPLVASALVGIVI